MSKALPGPEKFDIRTRQLQQAAPRVTVAPYFAHNLKGLLASPGTQ